MLEVLEQHLNEVVISSLPNRPIPSPSLLVALLDVVAVDPRLVGETLIETLNAIITGTTYGPAGSRASFQAHQASSRAIRYLDFTKAYGRRRPTGIGLTLPSGSGSPVENVAR